MHEVEALTQVLRQLGFTTLGIITLMVVGLFGYLFYLFRTLSKTVNKHLTDCELKHQNLLQRIDESDQVRTDMRSKLDDLWGRFNILVNWVKQKP